LFPHFNFSFSTLGNFYFSNVDALPSALVRKGKNEIPTAKKIERLADICAVMAIMITIWREEKK
jgi:hypothetical protein